MKSAWALFTEPSVSSQSMVHFAQRYSPEGAQPVEHLERLSREQQAGDGAQQRLWRPA